MQKIILTTVLAVLSVIVFGWIVIMQNHAVLIRNHTGEDTLKLEEISQTLKDIESAWESMEKLVKERYEADATLSALALRNIISESGDQAIALYTSGAVIKVINDEILAPEGIDRKLGLSTDMFEGRKGLFESPENPETLVVYSRISYPFYYIEWYEDTSIQGEVEEAINIPGILRKAETAFDVYALCAAEIFRTEQKQMPFFRRDFENTKQAPSLSLFDHP